MSKLDEFLSSEEAKKILQQTTEGDFTSTMSDLEPPATSDPAEVLGDDLLKMLDVIEFYVFFSNRAILTSLWTFYKLSV